MRGDGTTTRQMEGAPLNAVFVWCNGHLDYPKQLARKISRPDIEIVAPHTLEYREKWMGRKLTGLVLDHALTPTEAQYRGLDYIRACVR